MKYVTDLADQYIKTESQKQCKLMMNREVMKEVNNKKCKIMMNGQIMEEVNSSKTLALSCASM